MEPKPFPICLFVSVLFVRFCLFSYPLLAQDSTTVHPVSKNIKIQSFNKAKKLLHNAVFVDQRVTFYCGCRYDQKKHIDLSTCGYKPKTKSSRATHVEWDHIVPAESFGQSFKEWRDGHSDCIDNKGQKFKGRHCAEKVNMTFRYMQSDMYNLVPAEGEINGLRENFSMAIIPDGRLEFGDCQVKIQNRKFEPPANVRGDIARIYLYMDEAYPGHGIISNKNQKLFERWDKEDPVDALECQRVRKIEKLQGNRNDVVEELCRAAGL